MVFFADRIAVVIYLFLKVGECRPILLTKVVNIEKDLSKGQDQNFSPYLLAFVDGTLDEF